MEDCAIQLYRTPSTLHTNYVIEIIFTHAVKEYWRNGGLSPFILKLETIFNVSHPDVFF